MLKLAEYLELLIYATGFLVLTTALLWLSLFLLGRILKYLGYWKITLQAVSKIYSDRRKRART